MQVALAVWPWVGLAAVAGAIIGYLVRDLSLRKIWRNTEMEWEVHQREEIAKRDASIKGLEHRLAEAEKAPGMEALHAQLLHMQKELASGNGEITRLHEIISSHDDEVRRIVAESKRQGDADELIRQSP